MEVALVAVGGVWPSHQSFLKLCTIAGGWRGRPFLWGWGGGQVVLWVAEEVEVGQWAFLLRFWRWVGGWRWRRSRWWAGGPSFWGCGGGGLVGGGGPAFLLSGAGSRGRVLAGPQSLQCMPTGSSTILLDCWFHILKLGLCLVCLFLHLCSWHSHVLYSLWHI